MQVAPIPPQDEDVRLVTGAAPPGTPRPQTIPSGEDIATLRKLKDAALKQIGERPELEAAAAAAEAAEDDKIETRPREDIESVELVIPDGRVVEFGPVRMASFRVAEILGRDAGDPYLQMLMRVMLGVRAIDGRPVKPVTSLAEGKIVANKLGDETIDHLWLAMNEYWPPVTKKDLRVLKKNLRG